jgi:hypothetical protein
VVCPVVGAVAGRDFQNDWGYPRSGGRFHQGNDIFAAVARRSSPSPTRPSCGGTRRRRPTGLGGITVTYRTADGSEWYNAHLDTVADGIAPGVSVARGQTIGTVGQHRQRPDHAAAPAPRPALAAVWVNPWPTISPGVRLITRRRAGARRLARLGVGHGEPRQAPVHQGADQPKANTTVPAPTVPPSSHPPNRTLSSISGPGRTDRPAPAGQAGHDPVAGTRTEPGTDVEARPDREQHRSQQHHHDAQPTGWPGC